MIQFSMKMVVLALSVALFTACSSDKKSEKPNKVITVVTEATDLETAIKHKKTITHLELINEGLTEFPKEIAEFEKLIYLDISGNKISKIEGDFKKLSKLRYIDLSENELTDVPASFANLTKLDHLHLEDNLIQQVQTNMAEFPALTDLYLSSNPLIEFPSSTLNSKTLEYVECFLTFIKDVPELILEARYPNEVGLPTKLNPNSQKIVDRVNESSNLNIGQEPIMASISRYLSIKRTDKWGFEMNQFDSVIYLTLSGSEFTQIETNLRKYTRLEYLDLSNSNLKEIPDFLVEFKHLKYLDLSGNQIKVVDFERLPKNLILLDLSNNQLSTEFKASPFPYLEYLFLEQNALRSIVLSYAPRLKVADLSNNSHLKKANISAKNIKILGLPIAYKEHSLSAKSIFYR